MRNLGGTSDKRRKILRFVVNRVRPSKVYTVFGELKLFGIFESIWDKMRYVWPRSAKIVSNRVHCSSVDF